MSNSPTTPASSQPARDPFAKNPAPTPWVLLRFGRYKSKRWSLPQVIFHDPDYFFWNYDDGAFQWSSTLWRQAQILDAKATSIRIPQRGPERRVVSYNHCSDGSCTGFNILPESRLLDQGYSITSQNRCIDMSVPYVARSYDKRSNRLFLQSLKSHLFGEESFPMTKKRCEAFFDNDRNFHRNGSPESTPPTE
jgi:hypothetical protein